METEKITLKKKRATRKKPIEDFNHLIDYQPIYQSEKSIKTPQSNNELTNLFENVNLSRKSEPRLIKEESGSEKWVLELDDFFSFDDQPKILVEEITPPNWWETLIDWLKGQWKLFLLAFIFWAIAYYSDYYLPLINKHLGGFSSWIVKMFKNALEKEFKGVSAFNWIFYTLISFDIIKLISNFLFDFPDFLIEKIKNNKTQRRANLLAREKIEQAIIDDERNDLIKKIESDQEFVRRCRVIVHNQNVEDKENKEVLIRKFGNQDFLEFKEPLSRGWLLTLLRKFISIFVKRLKR